MKVNYIAILLACANCLYLQSTKVLKFENNNLLFEPKLFCFSSKTIQVHYYYVLFVSELHPFKKSSTISWVPLQNDLPHEEKTLKLRLQRMLVWISICKENHALRAWRDHLENSAEVFVLDSRSFYYTFINIDYSKLSVSQQRHRFEYLCLLYSLQD